MTIKATAQFTTSTIVRIFVVAALFVHLSIIAHSQLRVLPLERDGGIARSNSSARTKAREPLTLPFFDDFTKPLKNFKSGDLFPDTARWEDSYSVWVNNGMAINPPSFNVATFDGLDSGRTAYNATEIFVNGFTDQMTSHPVDLSETASVNAVSVAERNSVYLSFYYQWRGNGEAPNNQDYLQVEFLNDAGIWEKVLTINSLPTLDRTIFYPSTIRIDGDRFFTKKFQFRFRSYGRQSGPYDTWNIDYIYLNKGRTANDLSFPDQSVSSALSSIFLNRFRAMPYLHFLENPVLAAPQFNVFNLRGNPPEVLNYFTEATFTNFYYSANDTTSTVISLGNLDPDPAPPNSEGINDDGTGTINPFESRTVSVKYIGTIDTISHLDPNADAVQIDLKANLITGDNINPDTGMPADDYDPKYDPIDFRLNDTIRSSYQLSNYYAYDDGVAEYAGGLIAPGNAFAYQFDLPENLNDTLKILSAFDIYFPPFGLTTSQSVDFLVFDDEGGKPNQLLVRISSVTIRNEGNNRFQRIRFVPAVQIRQDKFYIGWRQPVVGEALVGIDNSNNTGDKMFFNSEGSINPDPSRWEQNTLITGSFMVRPIFTTGVVDPKVGLEEETKLDVYPNPNQGIFQISGKPERISIFTTAGQPVEFETDTQDDRTFIQLNVASGIYIVKYYALGVLHTEKILVTR